jgi:hypothetical protein
MAKNTKSEYVIRIAFPLQRWLRESSAVLRYTHIACLVLFQLCQRPYFFPNISVTQFILAWTIIPKTNEK